MVATVSGASRIAVSYNDETGQSQTIAFADQFSRLVTKGASLMGWSWSDDGGQNWTHGGPLATPKNWSVLWGDPAMAVSGSKSNIVFLSNLAVPDAKYPAGGISGSFASSPSNIGGACIAKSADGGKSFAIWQCVRNTAALPAFSDAVNGHFYDGDVDDGLDADGRGVRRLCGCLHQPDRRLARAQRDRNLHPDGAALPG